MSRYRIVSTWRVRATLEEVAAVLADVERLPVWWPSVYLDARVTAPGDATGVGREVALHTRGWLPYTLRWRFRVTEVAEGRVVLEPQGDFSGRGEWTAWAEGDTAVVRYDWDVEAHKPLLRALGPVLRPLFAWNHRWAMRRGEDSLAREVARRRAALGAAPDPATRSVRAPASP